MHSLAECMDNQFLTLHLNLTIKIQTNSKI